MKINEKTLDISLVLGALIAIITAMALSFTKNCEEMQSKAFRLHITANSDTAADQQLKYEVRDYIIEELGFIFGSCKSKNETVVLAERNLPLISERVNGYLESVGCDYRAVCTVEKCGFGTRKYGDYTLPAGKYDSLKITLGSGMGHNWWCVLFPTLCINAVSEKSGAFPERSLYLTEKARAQMTADSLAAEYGEKIEYKFRLYEWLRETFVNKN